MSELNFQLGKESPTSPWVIQQSEPGVSARSLVDERFDALAAMIGTSTASFNASLQKMRDALAPISVGTVTMDDVEMPTDLGTIPSFTGAFNKTFTDTLEDFDFTYTEPSDKPDASLVAWEDGTVSLEPELIAKLAEWITGNDSAISPALMSQIFNSAIVKHDEQRIATIAKLTADAAARGFDCPAEVIAAQVAQIEAEYSKASADISARVAEKNMELTQANFHKAIEVAASYVKEKYNYYIQKNMAKVQWYTSAVDAWIKTVQANISVIEAKVAAYNGKVTAFKAKADAYKTESEVFVSSIEAYKALVEGLRSKIDATISVVKAETEIAKTKAETDIKIQELNVNAQVANQQLAQRIAEAESSFHANITTGALTSIHVQASIGANHSTGQDVSYSYSYGEAMHETRTQSEQTEYQISTKV